LQATFAYNNYAKRAYAIAIPSVCPSVMSILILVSTVVRRHGLTIYRSYCWWYYYLYWVWRYIIW